MMRDRDLLDTLGPIIRDAEDRRFEPGFSGRVMERIRAEAEVPVIGLGTSSGQSVLETALGLEPLTVETAYALDQSFYATDDE
ncbi:MAG: hypothetical protein P8Y07_11645 [Gemmatimonadales bacterium]